jgi:hypothetical protein
MQVLKQYRLAQYYRDRNSEILRLRRSGYTYVEIGKKFNLTPARVSHVCIKARRYEALDERAMIHAQGTIEEIAWQCFKRLKELEKYNPKSKGEL